MLSSVSSISNIKKSFNKLCTPAQFYLVMSLFSLIIYLVNMMEHKHKMMTTAGISIQAVVVLVWTCVLNWICSMKYGVKISWFLVFLPLILLLILLVVFYHMIDTMGLKKEDLRQLINEEDEDKKYGGVEGSCSTCDP